MAEIKVSQLPEASQINDNDLIMIVQNGTNKKITKENCQFASGDEISIGTTEPVEEEKLWINPNESVNVYGSYISNEYGTSQAIGYSQEYINSLIKHTIVTGTTDSNGFVSSNLFTNNAIVLNAIYNSSSSISSGMIIPYIDGGRWTFKNANYNYNAQGNVSVSLDVYYIEI